MQTAGERVRATDGTHLAFRAPLAANFERPSLPVTSNAGEQKLDATTCITISEARTDRSF